MNCRYCGGVYAATERTCGGCGSPKTAVQTLLDVPAAPGHWSHSMGETVQRVAVISAAVAAGAWVLSLIGLSSLGAFFVFFWIIPISASMLGVGAWMSSKGDLQQRVKNCLIAGVFWIGVTIAMMLMMGILVGS